MCVLAFESIPKILKTEPDKGHDDAVASSSDESAGEPCLFCEKLLRGIVRRVGHVCGLEGPAVDPGCQALGGGNPHGNKQTTENRPEK